MSNSKSRIDVKKTYKLFIGGAFPRSESGRTYEVKDSKGNFVATHLLPHAKIYAMQSLPLAVHLVDGLQPQHLTAGKFSIASRR